MNSNILRSGHNEREGAVKAAAVAGSARYLDRGALRRCFARGASLPPAEHEAIDRALNLRNRDVARYNAC